MAVGMTYGIPIWADALLSQDTQGKVDSSAEWILHHLSGNRKCDIRISTNRSLGRRAKGLVQILPRVLVLQRRRGKHKHVFLIHVALRILEIMLYATITLETLMEAKKNKDGFLHQVHQ